MKNVLLVLLAVVTLSSCGQGGRSQAVLDPDEFQTKMDQVENKEVLDVRTDQEVKRGMIKGAIQLDIAAQDFKDRLAQLDTSKSYFVYCAGGVRSAQAARIMSEMGFTEVYDLRGGIGAWVSAGKPLD